MSESYARIVNLKAGPMDVVFTGEPYRVQIHWIQHDGRRGGTLPCQGDACPVHVGRPRSIALIAAVRRRERPARVSIDAEHASREKLQNFRRLAPEVRDRLLAEARRAKGESARNVPASMLEHAAADIMWPPKAAAKATEQAEYDPVIVDLPIGAAIECNKALDQAPWRGNRVLITRPHLGADAKVHVLERGIVVPEPISVPCRMAQHWGFSIDRPRVELDHFGNQVLTFAPASPPSLNAEAAHHA